MSARPTHAHLLQGRRLVPVILGGDIGSYSLARAFYDAFGVRSTVVSSTLGGVVRDSIYIDNVVEPRMDDADVAVATLLGIAERHEGADLIVCASADWLVRILVERRADLEPHYAVPYATLEALDIVTDKDAFGALCRDHGIGHPHTVTIDLAKPPAPQSVDLTFPVVAKAGNTTAYHAVEFTGKEKVFTVDTPAQLDALLQRIHQSGYRDDFIIQEFIAGDDSGLRILNTYMDRSGKARWTVFGHVLLQEHTPSTLGNSSVVLTVEEPQIVAAAERIMEDLGWRGVGSIDLKIDPRTGEAMFFELNPRLSRSNLYVTGSGVNPAVSYVREWILGLDPVGDDDVTPREHLFTVIPRALLRRYLLDAPVRATVRRLYRARRVSHALVNPRERHPRRWLYVWAHQLNQVRKYRRFYPRSVQRAERAQADALRP